MKSFENGVGNRGEVSGVSVLNESSRLNSNVGFIASTSVIERDRLVSSENIEGSDEESMVEILLKPVLENTIWTGQSEKH